MGACKDRLEEFRRRAQLPMPVYADTVCAVDGDAPPPLHHEMHEVFHEVKRVRGWTQQIREDTQLMRQLLNEPAFHNDKQLQERMDDAAARCGGAGLKAAGGLRQIEERARRLAKEGGEGGAVARMARLLAATSRRLFADALAQHHALLAAAQLQRRELLRQQLQLVTGSASDEECERLLAAEDLGADQAALFTNNVRAESAAARLALRDAEVRRDELLKTERALADVRDLFVQLHTLVQAQQDQLDNVEWFALQACDFVDGGQRQLLKGQVSRAKAKRKKLGLVVCLATGVGVVLLVLVLT